MTGNPLRRLGVVPLVLAACGGGGLNGSYIPEGGSVFLDQMVFEGGGKVGAFCKGTPKQ